MKADTTRLEGMEEYVAAKTTEIFGGDVKAAISILATFYDGGTLHVKNAIKISSALKPVNDYFIQQKIDPVYVFNNGAIFSDDGEKDVKQKN